MLPNRVRQALLGAKHGLRQGLHWPPCNTDSLRRWNGNSIPKSAALSPLAAALPSTITHLSPTDKAFQLSSLSGTCPFAQQKDSRDHHLCPQPWTGTGWLQKTERESDWKALRCVVSEDTGWWYRTEPLDRGLDALWWWLWQGIAGSNKPDRLDLSISAQYTMLSPL